LLCAPAIRERAAVSIESIGVAQPPASGRLRCVNSAWLARHRDLG
jgi:hypothetical protein